MQHIATAAFAKLNLGLEVLCKRDDGYHEINTVFVRVRLADTLLLGRTTDGDGAIHLNCTPDLGIPERDNLAYQAAQRLQMALGVNRGARILLHKRIPSGAGLGGGSSDAAAVLRQLPNLWDVEAPDCTLQKVAEGIGSDVPFFLEGSAAVGRGRGERLERFDVEIPWWTVIVHPRIHVSTPWAYRALGIAVGDTPRAASDFRAALLHGLSHSQDLRDALHNDFENVVFAEHPTLAEINKELYSAKALFAGMSGSGSAIFGFFTTEKAARAAATSFSKEFVHVAAPFAPEF